MKRFGIALKELRKSKGLTQTQLGKMLMLSGASISGYERGLHQPETVNYLRISRFMRKETQI